MRRLREDVYLEEGKVRRTVGTGDLTGTAYGTGTGSGQRQGAVHHGRRKVSRRCRGVSQRRVLFPSPPRTREEMLTVSVITVPRKAPCPGHSLLQFLRGRTNSVQKVGRSPVV